MKLSAAAVDVFRSIPKVSGSDYVFPPQRSDGGLHMVPPRKQWHAVLARAGITRNITLHDMRRSVGVLLATRGCTAEQIARQLNHKSNVTAKVYVLIADEILQFDTIKRVLRARRFLANIAIRPLYLGSCQTPRGPQSMKFRSRRWRVRVAHRM